MWEVETRTIPLNVNAAPLHTRSLSSREYGQDTVGGPFVSLDTVLETLFTSSVLRSSLLRCWTVRARFPSFDGTALPKNVARPFDPVYRLGTIGLGGTLHLRLLGLLREAGRAKDKQLVLAA